MHNRIAAMAVSGLVLTSLVACSSETSVNHPSQASVTVNGNTSAKQSVSCNQQANNLPVGSKDNKSSGQSMQWYWTILIGDQNVAGAKVSVNGSGEQLVTNSVRIRNLGGFTGMYSKDDGGEAQISFVADTFTITGKALGYNTSAPDEPTHADFKIVATC